MGLRSIDLEIPDASLPGDVSNWILQSRRRIELYWDCFREQPLPQYVECDFEYVALAIRECLEKELLDGRLFVEWGCGFAVVTGIAAILGLDAVGIEAEEFLCVEAEKLLQKNNIHAEVWHGNFLPQGARKYAECTEPLISLTHSIESAYSRYQMDISDFAMVFAYPWPGEEHFLRLVFERSARSGALLLMFRGPNQIELYRRT
ncbi:MAG: hypothetical protein KDB03_08885 [Planctomycetales bacterium]|nr:hypothetical protein [Planctomycetales bacterium]